MAKISIDRREFVVGAAATVAALTAIGSLPAEAAGPTWQETVDKILGGAKATEGKVSLELPEIAENGNTVPFKVEVESPMTEKDYVKAVHVISTGNPQPVIATAHFSPLSGKAVISSRMRLAKTQDIVAIAQLSNGQFVSGKKTVKVTIGGCGG